MADAIEGFPITDQNTQRSLRNRGWDADGNLTHEGFTTVRTQDGFNGNLVAGTGFGQIGSGAFQAGPSAVAGYIEVKLNTANVGHAVGVIIKAAGTLAPRKRSPHGGGVPALHRFEHIFYPHLPGSAL